MTCNYMDANSVLNYSFNPEFCLRHYQKGGF